MLFFGNKETASIRERNETLEADCGLLRVQKAALKEELEDLKLKRKIEEEDIKHMVQMKQDRLDLQHDKKMQALQAEFDKKEAASSLEVLRDVGHVKDEYRDKMEVSLAEQLTRMQTMYADILARLPNVNVKLKGNAG